VVRKFLIRKKKLFGDIITLVTLARSHSAQMDNFFVLVMGQENYISGIGKPPRFS
jgi:hypothetical protein